MDNLLGIKTGEDRIQERDFIDNHLCRGDLDSVTNIEWVFNEEENARTKKLLGCYGENK